MAVSQNPGRILVNGPGRDDPPPYAGPTPTLGRGDSGAAGGGGDDGVAGIVVFGCAWSCHHRRGHGVASGVSAGGDSGAVPCVASAPGGVHVCPRAPSRLVWVHCVFGPTISAGQVCMLNPTIT